MEFNVFAQLMYAVTGGADNTSVFVKTLFDAIITDDGRELLKEIKDSTYKAYYNGNTGISRIAKKIGIFIEPEEFVEYCNQFSDAVRDRLCDSFRPYLPDIDAYNVGEKLAGLFESIIKEATSVKKKDIKQGVAKGKDTDSCEFFDVKAEVVDDEEPSGAADENVQTDTRIQIVNNPTIVNQYGEKNIHIDHVDKLEL